MLTIQYVDFIPVVRNHLRALEKNLLTQQAMMMVVMTMTHLLITRRSLRKKLELPGLVEVYCFSLDDRTSRLLSGSL